MKQISRFSFIGGISTLSLAACSGSSVTSLNSILPGADPNPELYANMRRVGVNAFTDGKTTVVLPEFAGKSLFPSPAKGVDCGAPLLRRGHVVTPDCTGGSGGSALPVIATVSCSAGGSVTVGATSFDVTNVNVQGTFINTSGSQPGPMYAVNAPTPDQKDCALAAMEAIGNTILAIATWVQQNAAAMKLPAALAEEAGWVIAGEITLAEFGALALATLTGPELIAALAVAGTTVLAVAAVAAYIKCENGG